MNEVKAWVEYLYQDCENGAADEFDRGWNAALDKVIAILDDKEDLILEPASETKMMFCSDERRCLEDRKTFVRNLGKLAKQTRDGVVGAELDNKELVTVMFKNEGTHVVNVNMDSYAAIIRDVAKAIN